MSPDSLVIGNRKHFQELADVWYYQSTLIISAVISKGMLISKKP